MTDTDTDTDTDTARAFGATLPLTLEMSDLNSNEKFASLPQALPTHASAPETLRRSRYPIGLTGQLGRSDQPCAAVDIQCGAVHKAISHEENSGSACLCCGA